MPNVSMRSVKEVCQHLEKIINPEFQNKFWITGELSGFIIGVEKAKNKEADKRHIYFSLMEKAGETYYNLNAVIWARDADNIRKICMRFGLKKILDGMKVGLYGYLNYSAKFGTLMFNAESIDPAVTIGEHERLKREIIERLKKEGLFDRQKQLRFPYMPLRIALITSIASSAFNDFKQQFSSHRYRFQIKEFNTIMQGAETEKAVKDAITRILKENIYDCIVITRGGGKNSDLASFDNYEIAKSIAESGIPVLTAIGHTENISIADMTAYHYFKTPSAVAEFLFSIIDNINKNILELKEKLMLHLKNNIERLKSRYKLNCNSILNSRNIIIQHRQDCKNKISVLQKLTQRLCMNEQKHIIGYSADIRENAGRLLFIQSKRISSISSELRLNTQRFGSENKNRIHLYIKNLKNAISSNIKDQYNIIDGFTVKINLLHPENILERGYAIVYDAYDNVIASSDNVTLNSKIKTKLKDGIIMSTVDEINKKDGNK